MKAVGEHITWNGKSGELSGTVRSVRARYDYLVDIDGSTKQVIVSEYESFSNTHNHGQDFNNQR